MLPTDPLPPKPRPHWLAIVAVVAAGLRALIPVAMLAFCYDVVLVIIAFVTLAVTESGHSRNPSLQEPLLVLLAGSMLGGLVALIFAAKGHYWRALGVVLGLMPLFWLAQNL